MDTDTLYAKVREIRARREVPQTFEEALAVSNELAEYDNFRYWNWHRHR
jgi:hypothetical protein